ncbi:MAG TPA: pitrilysin family protein [Pyrinomonadaceae bacterium]|nr:pitrilysin family protein [Pyrinomonadaceae bacterium]
MKLCHRRLSLLLIAAFVGVSAVSAQTSRIDGFAAQAALVTEFDVNGLKVLVKRRANSPTVAGGLFIRGGARNINEKNAGIEYLMLSTAIEAGKNLPRQTVRRELASMGSGIAAASANDYSVASFGTTRQNFDRFWNIYAEVLMKPAFGDDEVRRNREQILTGLRESGTLPESALDSLELKAIYAGHPYANDVNGTITTVSSLTASDLSAYHKSVMETSRLLFIIVGDLDPEEVKSKIAATFGKLPRGSYKDARYPAIDFSKPTLDTTARALPTNYVKGTFAAPSPGSRDYYAMRVAVSILQTLVYQTVRQQLQLSYAPDASMNNHAANTANISVSTNDPNRAIAVMREQIKFLQERSLNEEVIEEISAFFLTRHYIGQETSGAQVGDLALYELNGGGWRNSFEFMNGVRSVKSADVRRVANQYMKNLRFTYLGNVSSVNRAVFVE